MLKAFRVVLVFLAVVMAITGAGAASVQARTTEKIPAVSALTVEYKSLAGTYSMAKFADSGQYFKQPLSVAVGFDESTPNWTSLLRMHLLDLQTAGESIIMRVPSEEWLANNAKITTYPWNKVCLEFSAPGILYQEVLPGIAAQMPDVKVYTFGTLITMAVADSDQTNSVCSVQFSGTYVYATGVKSYHVFNVDATGKIEK